MGLMRIQGNTRVTLLLCFSFALSLAVVGTLRSKQSQHDEKPAAAKKNVATGNTPEAIRLNTLGVAYMNQQKPAEAQKYFEQALAADSNFAMAQMNLGISLLAQQKLEAARTTLEQATAKLPNDPFGWYNLGLTYKDTGESEKGLDAFAHVGGIAPQEPDALYFIGYLNSQLQRYDAAISAC